MMCKQTALTLLGLFHISFSSPLITLHDLEASDDTQSVGSYIREVRAAPPQSYHHSHHDDGDGEIGYSRKKDGGGKKGYQFFDAYHKKAGDNYEFEKQDSYGQDDDDEKAAHSHRHETRAKLQRPRRQNSEASDGSSEKGDEYYGSYEENDERPKKNRKDKDEIRNGEPEENGSHEGHDPSDYILPEKYTYGQTEEDEEYNFK